MRIFFRMVFGLKCWAVAMAAVLPACVQSDDCVGTNCGIQTADNAAACGGARCKDACGADCGAGAGDVDSGDDHAAVEARGPEAQHAVPVGEDAGVGARAAQDAANVVGNEASVALDGSCGNGAGTCAPDASPTCDAMRTSCAPRVCVPDQWSCTAKGRARCSADGTELVLVAEACAYCDPVDPSVCRQCRPGAPGPRCASSTETTVCKAGGDGYVSQACPQDRPACSGDGECAPCGQGVPCAVQSGDVGAYVDAGGPATPFAAAWGKLYFQSYVPALDGALANFVVQGAEKQATSTCRMALFSSNAAGLPQQKLAQSQGIYLGDTLARGAPNVPPVLRRAQTYWIACECTDNQAGPARLLQRDASNRFAQVDHIYGDFVPTPFPPLNSTQVGPAISCFLELRAAN